MSAALIARPALVDVLLADGAPVVLVMGKSGAGKSQVLRDAIAAVRPQRNVAGPRETMYSSPCLQLVLDGFADIVAQVLAAHGTAERVGERLSRAVERLIETKGRELAVAAGREIVNLIRTRLGDDAGQALTAAVRALHQESTQTLGSRLDRARPETALEVIVGFAREIVEMSESRPAVVVLDRCERLDEVGARLLADLSELLPVGIQIWAAIRNDSDVGRFLMSTPASLVDVTPLDKREITEILRRRGSPVTAANEILELTDGTALDVQACVGLLERGAPESFGADEALARDTQQRIAMLAPNIAPVALRLAALNDPLPERYLLRFTGEDRDELDTVMTALGSVGLLTAHGDGEWIHERRRHALLETAKPQDFEPAITDATTAVWEYIQAGGDEHWLVELADLAAQASTLADDDNGLRAVLNLNDSPLAVLGALMELTEPSSQAVDGEALLSFARSAYPTDDLELEHLQELRDADLVAVVSNDATTVVILQLSRLASAVALGRVGRVFGQLPVPGIASVAFREVLLPRIQPFAGGVMGVGRPSVRRLSYMAIGREEDIWDPVSSIARRDMPPALIVRAAFAGRPLYGAFRFESLDARDRGLDAVMGLDVEFLNDRFAVTTAAAYPMTAVPVDRFLRAAERIIGRAIQLTIQDIRERLAEPITFEERAELRVRTRKVLRDLAGAGLRGAMELDRPLGLHWTATENSHIEVEVLGGRELAMAHQHVSKSAQTGPYHLFHLARELGLQPGEVIGRVHRTGFNDPSHAPTNFDPVLAEIGSRRAAAIAFNEAQRTVPVRLDESLIEQVGRAFHREMADARSLAASVPLLGRRDWQIPATAKYVVLADEPPHAGWAPGARSALVWAETLSLSGHDECHVILGEGRARDTASQFTVFHPSHDTLEELPNFDGARVVRSGEAITRTGVASLLGHRVEDLGLVARGEDS